MAVPNPRQMEMFGGLPPGILSLTGLAAKDQARRLLEAEVRYCLKEHELKFLSTIARQFERVTPQQNKRLRKIVDRLRGPRS
jgi:hypothetical protein